MAIEKTGHDLNIISNSESRENFIAERISGMESNNSSYQKTEDFFKFLAVDSAVNKKFGSMSYFIDTEKENYGIRGISKRRTPIGLEKKIVDNKGNTIMRMSSVFDRTNVFSSLIELPTLAILQETYKIVKISEYRLGVEGALRETTYTPEGKRTHERGEQKMPILEKITYDDITRVEDIVENAIKEATLRIHARIPLQEETLLGRDKFKPSPRFVR